VPVIVHVAAWVHGWHFVGHGNLPELRQAGRAGRGRGRGVEHLPFRSTGPMLHYLLIFGALVLKPYFYLQKTEQK